MKKENYNILLQQIKEKVGKPVSSNVVVAIIESFGVRDIDTANDYGFSNIKELAEKIFIDISSLKNNDLKNYREIENKKETEDLILKNRISLFSEIKLIVKKYLLNSSHLLALMLQIVTIVVFGFALYVYISFNEPQSTSVVLGVILGMILSGGLINVIGKEVSNYYNYKDFAMAKHTLFFLIKLGVVKIIGILLVLLVLNYIVRLFPMIMMLLTAFYTFFIGTLFLVLAPLHTINKKVIILISISTGTALGLFLLLYVNTHIYIAHLLGIITSILVPLIYYNYYFKKRIKGDTPLKKVKLTALFFNNFEYYIYGLLMNIFFFIDRIVAWTGDSINNYFFLVFYEKNYEIGMDISILFYLLLAGTLELSASYFVKLLDDNQKTTLITNKDQYLAKINALYKKNLILLTLFAILIFFLMLYIMYGNWGYNKFFEEPLTNLSIRVAFMGIVSYYLLCWGMLNALYLFTLNQKTKLIKFLFISCIVNLVIGLIASRFISYEYSVLGLISGALTFLLLTKKENKHFFKHIDYYYYAAH